MHRLLTAAVAVLGLASCARAQPEDFRVKYSCIQAHASKVFLKLHEYNKTDCSGGFRTGEDGKLVQEKLHYDGMCSNALFLYVKTSKVGDKVLNHYYSNKGNCSAHTTFNDATAKKYTYSASANTVDTIDKCTVSKDKKYGYKWTVSKDPYHIAMYMYIGTACTDKALFVGPMHVSDNKCDKDAKTGTSEKLKCSGTGYLDHYKYTSKDCSGAGKKDGSIATESCVSEGQLNSYVASSGAASNAVSFGAAVALVAIATRLS